MRRVIGPQPNGPITKWCADRVLTVASPKWKAGFDAHQTAFIARSVVKDQPSGHLSLMSDTTKDQFIAAATSLFAERGFYGVSIAAIAEELGLTKQALLHHFGSKEKLYGEVLRTLGAQLLNAIDQHRSDDPAKHLQAFMLAFADQSAIGHDAQSLIIRELMDNKARLADAETWYLKPFLDRLIALYRAIPGRENTEPMQALAVIYQLIGAVSYFEISHDTLSHMYGADAFETLSQAHPDALRAMITATLNASI